VNVGLSVSRVGGAAQSGIMKKSAGTVRLDLAQYREMQIFSRFGGNLDENTRSRLRYGEGLMRLLRQPTRSPLPLWQQIVLLTAAQEKYFTSVPTARIDRVRKELLTWFGTAHGSLTLRIETKKEYSPELREKILSAVAEFFAAGNG
ncbi:MAG: F0F1 ATP synthase subunit alpha, partial [Clostridia bacterium]|nr:F0F1 ATP synthase subunit alpha [Clostridia bacterium]